MKSKIKKKRICEIIFFLDSLKNEGYLKTFCLAKFNRTSKSEIVPLTHGRKIGKNSLRDLLEPFKSCSYSQLN